jgi:glycerophosphoryl diester phosphodiesterase
MQSKKLAKLFVCLVLIFICTSNFAFAKCPTRMGSIFIPNHFLVIARGGSVSQFPENTLLAFQQALSVDGANALEVDLSLTKDNKIILWRDWDPNSPTALSRQENGEAVPKFKPSGPSLKDSKWRKKVSKINLADFISQYGYLDKVTHAKSNIQIPTFQNLIMWANQQEKLKLLYLKLKAPKDEYHLAPVMLEEIKTVINDVNPNPGFQIIISTPHKEIFNLVRQPFDEFQFSFDRAIYPEEIINYHSFTTVPIAMALKNSFSSIGLPFQPGLASSPSPDPWLIYKYILTLDFKLRDNYKKSTSNYIKIIGWTFNDEKKMRCLINLGIDGIVTDKPKLLRRIALDMGKTLN